MSDPIAPPAARRPSEAAELVALAVSDGDLGAAVAQYEPAAALLPLASQDGGDGLAGRDSPNGHPGNGGDGRRLAETMAGIMRLRLPLDVRLIAVLPAAGLTMLVCERRIAGQGPDGQPVSLHGVGCTVVRPQDDGTWRIAADAWQLTDNSGAE
ncbi:hypothetical protein EAS64_01690 [Trebonia kvetii]|uniref:DUF4440 domain-containing protein n=1 Tax=Trebonia kvetii TaxID=2480626 RepID=A0A6P2C820_9ACTN|nr:hypothetical protein [Trebonia kvetii]TVZ06181.1 hypothetical protein EAS64_01690 [Trebonia kvetii]